MAHTAATIADAPAPSPNGGYILAATGAALFSTKGILIKLAYGGGATPDVDTITLLALRMAFALPFFAVIGVLAWRARAEEGYAPLCRGDILLAAFLGLLGYYVSSYLDFKGLVYLSAQFERLILMTYPLFVTLLGAAFFGGAITAAGVVALLVSYSGIAVIFAHGATATGEHVIHGVAFVASAAFTFALYQLLARPLIVRIGSRVFTSIAMGAAGVVVLVHFLAAGGLARLDQVPVRVVWLAAAMAVTATVLPSFMLSAALRRIGAQAVSAIGTVSPVATVVMAIALLGEPFTATDALGTGLVILGIGLFTWHDSRRRRT